MYLAISKRVVTTAKSKHKVLRNITVEKSEKKVAQKDPDVDYYEITVDKNLKPSLATLNVGGKAAKKKSKKKGK